MGDPSRERSGETSQRPEVGGSWAERWAEECRAYIVGVCGPETGQDVLEQALGTVIRVLGDGGQPPSVETRERVRAAIRDAALVEVERRGAGMGARVKHLTHLGLGCAEVPGLLRERAAGRLTPEETLALYRRLGRCRDSVALTIRLDTAEWRLHEGLALPRLPPSSAAAKAPDAGASAQSSQSAAAAQLRSPPPRTEVAPAGRPATVEPKAATPARPARVEPKVAPAGRPARVEPNVAPAGRPPAGLGGARSAPAATGSPIGAGIRRGSGSRRWARAAAGVAVLLALAGLLVVIAVLSAGGNASPVVIAPSSRQALASVASDAARTPTSADPRANELLLGSAQPRKPPPAAATLAAAASAAVLGSPQAPPPAGFERAAPSR